MAELTFRSAGVATREIDLTGPTANQPSGIPAAVIGTANRGPAFVPITVATFQDFVSVFGPTDGEKFGPLAMREWLRNAGSGVYVRVLGSGDGRKRNTADGDVTRAGFYVGNELVQSNGLVGANSYATKGLPVGFEQSGRTYFLGAFMSESAGSTVFSSAGIVAVPASGSVPIIRGVVMAPSGVVLTLASGSEAVAANTVNGHSTGTVNLLDDSTFSLLLNGHTSTARYKNVITASFDPSAPNYFSQVLNTDPDNFEQAGHYLYAHYDIWSAEAVVTGSGVITGPGNSSNVAFLLSGSNTRGAGSTILPDYEEFRDRYRAAFSPWFISQEFGGQPVNLFKVHSLDDGAAGSSQYKISILNITPSTDEAYEYGSFDLLVRDFTDTDTDPIVLERYSKLNLDPNSDRYIARVIGDQYVYYDWDKDVDDQRLVIEGSYANQSRYIRIEVQADVEDGVAEPTALPVGYRGHHHLLTSGTFAAGGTGFLATHALDVTNTLEVGNTDANILRGAVQPPVPMRINIALDSGLKVAPSNRLYWGTQFEFVDDLTERNKNTKRNRTIDSLTKYFPIYHTSEVNVMVGDNAGTADGGTIFDSDRFNNNKFTLEKVAVRTGSDGVVDVTQWASATYARDGVSPGGDRRFLSVATDFNNLPSRPYIKFSTFVQGGFDGLDLFDENKRELNNTAVIREFGDTSQGESNGPTVQAYRRAVEILGAQANADIQLLAIPGIRHQAVTDFTIDEVEERFDAFYIMDIPEYDTVNTVVTSSDQTVSVNNTVNAFSSRNLDSSFAAAYFPDVVVEDPTTRTNMVVPPSVGVLGAFALNDAIGHPWFAPAGFTRGSLTSVEEVAVKVNRTNMDALQDADINPLVAFPGQGPTVFGQKTLLKAESSLDRVNVRRLLIDVRRKIRAIGNEFIFEPARATTLERFSRAVNPVLANIQAQSGLKRFRVNIDTTTTTQADIENNTLRGKIFLQPIKSVEFISLDFVITNAGAEV